MSIGNPEIIFGKTCSNCGKVAIRKAHLDEFGDSTVCGTCREDHMLLMVNMCEWLGTIENINTFLDLLKEYTPDLIFRFYIRQKLIKSLYDDVRRVETFFSSNWHCRNDGCNKTISYQEWRSQRLCLTCQQIYDTPITCIYCQSQHKSGSIYNSTQGLWLCSICNADLSIRKERHRMKRYSANTPAGSEEVTFRQWIKTLENFGRKCAYCVDQGFQCVEHFIPLSDGGKHIYNNIVPACFRCNTRKKDYVYQSSDEEYPVENMDLVYKYLSSLTVEE